MSRTYRRNAYSLDDGRPRRSCRPWSRETCRTLGGLVLATPESIRAQQANVLRIRTAPVETLTPEERLHRAALDRALGPIA